MVRLLAAVLLLTYSLFVWAMAYPEDYSGVPHDNFKEGDVIDHEKFNANNLSIKNAINANKAALPPTNCTTDQIIKWNGSAWVCADSPTPQIVNNYDLDSPESQTITAVCPEDTRLTGGGCIFAGLEDCVTVISSPRTDSYRCQASGQFNCAVTGATAICQ